MGGSLEVSVQRSHYRLFTILGSWVKFQLRKKRFRSLKIKLPKSLKNMTNSDSNSLFWEEGRVQHLTVYL